MAVYVDDMRAPFRRMAMCHMIADTDVELHAMAAAIGVAQRWHQDDHYDACLSMRAHAVRLGTIEITLRQCGSLNARRRATESLGGPNTAEQWLRDHIAAKNACAA